MLKRTIIISSLLFSVMCFAASNSAPLQMLEKMSNSLLSQLSASKDINADKHAQLVNIIKSTLLPQIDENQMSKIVVGPIYWRSATAAEREEFTKEFTHMVTNNYARIFAVYSDQKVIFLPSRYDLDTASRIEVNSLVTSKKGADFKVSYKLQKNKSGKWMIYDFAIDGISMTESYKAQFASTLADEGLAGTIANIKKYNNRPQK